jgi:hypothetical protein
MARRRKDKPYVARLTQATDLMNMDPRVVGTSQFRTDQAQQQSGSSGTSNGPVSPSGYWDPETREWVSNVVQTPQSTRGAGSSEAQAAVAARDARTQAKPTVTPSDDIRRLQEAFGITPAIGKAMLHDAGAYMRAFTGNVPREEQPPGFFEEHFKDKDAGKAIDNGIQNGVGWFSNLFDYKDESDLHLGPANLSAVESIFDGTIRVFDEAHNVSMWASSAALLAVNRNYWANRDSDYTPGYTLPDGRYMPPTGQLGNLWQDAAVTSPGRAQAALESSLGNIPLTPQSIPYSVLNPSVDEQQYQTDPNFDISNPQQAEEMYNRPGMSARTGINDAAMGVVLDPTIIGGKFAMLFRGRFLDRLFKSQADIGRMVAKTDESHVLLDNLRKYIDDADNVVERNIEDLTPDEIASINGIDEYSRLAHLATAREETAASLARRSQIDSIPDEVARKDALDNFTPEYKKRVDEDVIFNHHLLEDAANRDALSQALHKSQTFEQATLILRHAAGDMNASQALDALAPQLYMHVVNGERKLLERMLRSDPDLLSGEIAKWESREAMLQKRIDDLVELQADDSLIASHRATLSEIQDTLDFARNAEVPTVGAGPKPSREELDLAQRAIDAQLENNRLFEAALRDAEGGEHLWGALQSNSKGVAGFADGLDPNSVLAGPASALDRVIANSRINRAERKAAVQQSGGVGGAVKTGWSQEFYGIDTTNPIARVLAVPARIAGSFEAGVRYGWVEKPSGLIHTSGISAQESSREIRAIVNSVKMFHQPARQGRDGEGNLLYRAANGKTTTKAVDAKGKPNEALIVGGREHADRIVQGYLNAMLLGGREGQAEARRFIDKFETDMVDAVAHYHGIDVNDLTSAHYRINERLMDIQKTIQEQRYWTDKKSPTRNYAPWLETHLQNSSFMKNWREIDNAAHRLDLARKAGRDGADIGDKLRWRRTSSVDFTKNLFDTTDGAIQSVWRPLVLARGGYTIRNTAEGLFRSSAYLFSAMPVINAGQQLAMSSANVGRRATRMVARAEQRVEKAKAGAGFEDLSPGFQRWRDREVRTATAERNATRDIVSTERTTLAEGSAAYRSVRIQQLDTERGRLHRQANDARRTIDEADSEPFPSVEQEAARARAEAVLELAEDRIADMRAERYDLTQMTGGRTALTPTEREAIDTLDYLENVDIPYRDMQLIALSDPTLAAQARLNQTMAKRRVYGKGPRHITDTDTMASVMKGRATADAFDPDDPYTALALQNLSADVTVRQTAAMRMKAVTGGMAAYETRYYVNVNPGDPTYFDGVATAANQIMNSDIGQFMIQGRAQGLGEDEIIANIVRFLYSDEGASTASFLNEASDMAFKGAHFESLSTQTRAALIERVRENAPLYAALDTAQAEFRAASSIANDAAWQMPKPRFEGDSPNIPKRGWDDGRFGDYATVSTGRGKWQVTDHNGETVWEGTKKSDARAQARALQTADDDITRAHWTRSETLVIDGHEFRTPGDVRAFLDEAQAKRDAAAKALAKAETQPLKIKGNGDRMNVGPVVTPEAIRKQITEGDGDMYDAIEYAREVIRRYDQITAGSVDLQKYLASIKQLPIGGSHDPKAAGEVMRRFLEGNENLQPVVGNAAQWVGVNDMQAWFHGKTQKLFRWLGTIPEDNLVRAPFYGQVFRRESNRMTSMIAEQRGGMLSMNDVNKIREMAHRRAMRETKKWLYTIDRRTTFADTAERFVPFASAMQNGVTTVGRLAWQDPSIPAIMAAIWKAPEKAGMVDEENNVHVPIGWVDSVPGLAWAKERMGLNDELIFNKDSANLVLNGVTEPSASPMQVLLASEMMKNNWLGVTPETPFWLKPFGGAGDALWDGIKLYHFGREFGASTEFASWDKIVVPWISRLAKGIIGGPGSSAAFGNTFSALQAEDAMKVYSGEKDKLATYDELVEQVEAVTVARSLAQLAILPIAPRYATSAGDVPLTETMRQQAEAAGLGTLTTLGEAMRANDKLWYDDQARIADAQARQAAGEMVPLEELEPRAMPSEKLFGEAVWRAYKVASTENVSGLPSTQDAVAFAQEHEALLSDIASDLEPHQMLSVIGMFADNPNDLYKDDPYDPNARAWFVANQIPGTNEQFIDVDDPMAGMKRAEVVAGWKVYSKAIDALEIDALRNGITPPFSASSAKESEYYQRKREIEAFVGANYAGWDADKRLRDDSTTLTAEIIHKVVNDKNFQKSKANDPVWRKGGYADIYVTERQLYRDTVNAIKADARANGVYAMNPAQEGKSDLYEEAIADAKARWASTQYGLRKASPSWQAIQDRYLGDDLDPAAMSESVIGEQEKEAS